MRVEDVLESPLRHDDASRVRVFDARLTVMIAVD